MIFSAWLNASMLLLAFLFLPAQTNAATLSLSVGDIVAPDMSMRGIVLGLDNSGAADLTIAALQLQQRTFKNLKLHCAEFSASTVELHCRQGRSPQFPGTAIDFDYRFDRGEWQVLLTLTAAAAQPYAQWLPQDMPLPNHGKLDGTVRVAGAKNGLSIIKADVRASELGFSDQAGLHAAENLRASLRLDAQNERDGWQWNAMLDWRSGDLFWQPLFLRGGLVLNGTGRISDTEFRVDRLSAETAQIGKVELAGIWQRQRGEFSEYSVRGKQLGLEHLFADFVRPYLDKSALAETSLSGRADVESHYRDGALRSLQFTLHDAAIEDKQNRFAMHGLNTQIDWQPEGARNSIIRFQGGKLLGAEFGASQFELKMQGSTLDANLIPLPLLDGKLDVRDFHLHREQGDWHWSFAAALGGISMEHFSRAIGWPVMHGKLAARIPRVTYDGSDIKVDGALMFNVFDGTVIASQLRMADPFGRAPKLSGNLDMHELDLDLLTRTFSFGNMQGRIDVSVKDLQLQDWQPVRFDASLFSSAGNYPKKISQKAVQNISSLGGAGAAAAIQRSYLRFFENFGYDRIGWRCVMRNNVCNMSGVEARSDSGAYAIVKGGGIPAINVMGYNHSVSWKELVTRLKRVTQNNVKAVVN